MSITASGVHVGPLVDIQQRGVKVVHAAGRPIAVFWADGAVYAIDNRCPHMGFPLHKGTVKDGILTCHWHEARFDLSSGCTFDLWADDAPVFGTQVIDGEVYLQPTPSQPAAERRQWDRLRKGMEQNIRLIQSKALLGLRDQGASMRDVLRAAALFGADNHEGWGGMTDLVLAGHLGPCLGEQTAYLALSRAVREVAGACAGAAPRRRREPLGGNAYDVEQLERWLRHWVRGRQRDGVERCLLTAIDMGCSHGQLTHLLGTAANDRVYAGLGGHTLDAVNKALELLDLIGHEHAADILPLVVPLLATSRGVEEDSHWHHPVEIIEPLTQAQQRIAQQLATGRGRAWHEDGTLLPTLMSDDPLQIIGALGHALADGAEPASLARHVAYAAALRLAHFAESNEVGDWFNPQHTFIFANAVCRMVQRSPTPGVVRAIFHAALAVYMDRFLNVPPARLPGQRGELDRLPDDPHALRQQLLDSFDQRHQVQAAARLTARYVRLGHPLEPLVDTLTFATVREDLDFHTLQVLEAGVQQCRAWNDRQAMEHILVGVVRSLAAMCPTRRANLQTATTALRLHHGERIYDEEPEAAE